MPLEGRCKRAPAFVRGEGPMGPVRSGGRQTHAATPDGPDPSRADLDAGRSPQRCTNDQTSACSRHPRGRHRAGRLLPGSVTHADLRGWRRPPHTDREPDGERSTRFLRLPSSRVGRPRGAEQESAEVVLPDLGALLCPATRARIHIGRSGQVSGPPFAARSWSLAVSIPGLGFRGRNDDNGAVHSVPGARCQVIFSSRADLAAASQSVEALSARAGRKAGSRGCK